MKRDRRIEKGIAQVRYRSDEAVRARIRRHLDGAWSDGRPAHAGTVLPRVWRTSTLLYKPALAALTLVAIIGLVGLLHQSAGPAYALEQTVDAVKDIRYFHFQYLGESGEPRKEAWVEYDPNNCVRRVRVNFYSGRMSVNSAVVWSPEATQWRSETKGLFIYDDQEYTNKVLFFVRRYDPKQAIPYLQEGARHGGIQVEIEQAAGPVVVTVTYEPNAYMLDRPLPCMRELFSIDPATKLITRVETQTLREGGFVCDGAYEYLDYNRPFDDRIFDLRRETPPDVNVSDTTGMAMGLAQGGLSDEEIASKVVREFLEAWAAKDYDRATQIHGFLTLGERQSIRDELLLRKNILRVISVGPPVVPEPPLTGLLVPCEVEYEEDGQTRTGPLEFRTSEGARGRWRLRGPQ